MKKSSYLVLSLIVGFQLVTAKPVTQNAAMSVASAYYNLHSTKGVQTMTLVYTEVSSAGEDLYYVYNINSSDGFIIITADDAAHPVLGYSTENRFVVPDVNSTIGYWMHQRKLEIQAIKNANVQASEAISLEWQGKFPQQVSLAQRNKAINSPAATSVAPLVQTTWDQSPNYNALCPGTGHNRSVTGCVATCMAQVMRFWKYPSQGIGSNSYCDCTADGFTDQWGTLSANFGTTTYNWSGMPLSVTSANTAVATLMYDCGVSVDMDYASESGAFALSAETGGGPCSQVALVNYFGYDASTIQGYQKDAGPYSDSAWISIIETDLNAGRPVMYEGYDATQGGHCWVCDGYNTSNELHMNWGWSGMDDGYFTVTNLTTAGNFNPILGQEVLVGIQPPPAVDAGVASILSPSGTNCGFTFNPIASLQDFGIDTIKTCTLTCKLDSGIAQIYNWTGSLTIGQQIQITMPSIITTAGTHTLSCTSSLPNNTIDGNPGNDASSIVFISDTTGIPIPFNQGFEASTNLPAGWSLSNPVGYPAWQVVDWAAYSGTNCIGFDNFDGFNAMVGEKAYFHTQTYDFSTATANASMSFDVAYIVVQYNGAPLTDSLVILASVDCGTTWTQVYKKGGDTLSTAGQTANDSVSWQPTTLSNWRSEIVPLGNLAGHKNVMFAFENISDFGEWIYVDNINISPINLTGIAPIKAPSGISEYPNPAHSKINISITGNASSISVIDILGQTVMPAQIINDSQKLQTLDISSLANGVYLVKVNRTDGQASLIRFVKN